MEISGYSIQKLVVPCEPPISDSQTDDDVSGISYLKLETDTGHTGVGFGGVRPSLPTETLRARFEKVGEQLVGRSPFHLLNQMTRPRGGNYSRVKSTPFSRVIDFALWDLCGKHLGMPLYELLGGTDREVPAYVSGLFFTRDDDLVRHRYERYADMGFNAAKVKVGYDTIDEDLRRLEIVADALGTDCTLMVDANEAWSPKEAIRRAHAYRDAGFDIYWIEDPVFRDDVEGLRRVVDNVPFAHINAGEYVNFEGKSNLIRNEAVDILNLRTGLISTALDAASMAHASGIPTHVGHAPGHIGVHLAAGLPELTYIEWWDRPWDDLVTDPVSVKDGCLIAPKRPGHGLTLSQDALQQYGKPE